MKGLAVRGRVFLHTKTRVRENLYFAKGLESKLLSLAEALGIKPSDLERMGLRPVHVFGSLGCLSAQLESPSSLRGLRRLPGGVEAVEPVPVVEAFLVDSAPMVGAPAAWESGYTGRGVRIAVVDSGVDSSHPELRGRVVAEKSFTPEPPGDFSGHGTHVAGIAASSGEVYRGIAPSAELVNAKVLNSSGRGFLDDVIAAVGWAVREARADIVNMSFGVPYKLVRMAGALLIYRKWGRKLIQDMRRGVIYVAAAGNERHLGENSIGLPAVLPGVVAVGSVSKEGRLASYSSVGSPELEEALGEPKPTLLAPGGERTGRADLRDGIISAYTTQKSEYYREKERGIMVDPLHASLTGTSMAAPHVAGAAALLLEAMRERGYAREDAYPVVCGALASSAKKLPRLARHEQGYGLLDVAGALERVGRARARLPDPDAVDRLARVWTRAPSRTVEESPLVPLLGAVSAVGLVAALAALPLLAATSAPVRGRVEELKRKLEVARRAYESGLISWEEYVAALRRIEKELEDLMRG